MRCSYLGLGSPATETGFSSVLFALTIQRPPTVIDQASPPPPKAGVRSNAKHSCQDRLDHRGRLCVVLAQDFYAIVPFGADASNAHFGQHFGDLGHFFTRAVARPKPDKQSCFFSRDGVLLDPYGPPRMSDFQPHLGPVSSAPKANEDIMPYLRHSCLRPYAISHGANPVQKHDKSDSAGKDVGPDHRVSPSYAISDPANRVEKDGKPDGAGNNDVDPDHRASSRAKEPCGHHTVVRGTRPAGRRRGYLPGCFLGRLRVRRRPGMPRVAPVHGRDSSPPWGGGQGRAW